MPNNPILTHGIVSQYRHYGVITPVYTGCATYSPYFATTSASSGFLNADVLISNNASVGAYVIEWRLNSSNGETVFVSGNGADASIQAQHPIVNEVVFSGTLYPIIKYVWMDSSKYTLNIDPSGLYSPDFINCLPPTYVQTLDCSTVLGIDKVYPYFLQYLNATDLGTNKSRLLKYDRCQNVSYLAWEFTGYEVAEQIKFTYCTSTNSTGTLIDNFIIGTTGITENLYPVSYPTNPRIYWNSGGVKFITDLRTIPWNQGDYVKIQVTGSVYDPSNINTNWDLKLKSLPGDLSIGWNTTSAFNKLILVANPCDYMTYLADPNCRYEFTYDTSGYAYDFPWGKNGYATQTSFYPNIWKYTELNTWGQYNPAGNTYTSPVKLALNWSSIVSNYSWTSGPTYTDCINCSSGQNITMALQNVLDGSGVDASAWVFTFTDINDYSAFKSNVDGIKASGNYTQWVNTINSSIWYYSYYNLTFRCASSCGDTGTDYPFYFHFSTDVSFNPVSKVIKFIMKIPPNYIIDTSCNKDYEHVVNTLIPEFTATKTGGYVGLPTTKVSQVRKRGPIIAFFPSTYVTQSTITEPAWGYRIHEVMLNNIFDVSVKGFHLDISTGDPYGTDTYFRHYWTLLRAWDRFRFTGSTVDNSSRLENWRLDRRKFLRTDNYTTDYAYETIYDVSHGVLLP